MEIEKKLQKINHQGKTLQLMATVLVLEGAAEESDTSLIVETKHQDECRIFREIGSLDSYNRKLGRWGIDNEPDQYMHLEQCTCEPVISATFQKDGSRTLLSEWTLMQLRELYPWLDDEDVLKELFIVEEQGRTHPTVKAVAEKMGSKLSDAFTTRIDSAINA